MELKALMDKLESAKQYGLEKAEKVKEAQKKAEDSALCHTYQRKADEEIMRNKLAFLADKENDGFFASLNGVSRVKSALESIKKVTVKCVIEGDHE